MIQETDFPPILDCADISKIVEYLDNERCLGESPRELPRIDPEKEDLAEVDMDRLLSGDDWDFESSGDCFDEELQRAFHMGPPRWDDSNITNSGGNWPFRWEICAWYNPIHYFPNSTGPNSWGIYIRQDCVFRTAYEIARFVPRYSQEVYTHREWRKRLRLAALFSYYLHEHYHHRIESLGIRLLVIRRIPSYRDYDLNIYQVLQRNAGLPSHQWQNGWDPEEQIEEALANANSYQRIGDRTYGPILSKIVVQATRECLTWQFRNSPPGYRKAGHYLGRDDFRAGENILKERVMTASLASGPASHWVLAPGISKGLFGNRTKFWSVVDKHGRCYFPRK
jgi:hypothetical protein